MSDVIAFLRTNPVVLAILAGVTVATLVLGFIAFLMIRAGVSVRPVVFVAVFMAIIGGPQIAFHLSQAMGWIPAREFTCVPKADRGALYGFTENESVTAVVDGKFVHAKELFGPDADMSLVTDLRQMPSGPFSNAEAAQMAILPQAGSMIAARFATPDQAKTAGMLYMGQVTGTSMSPGPDGMWAVTRPAGDVLKGVAAGRVLLFASGATEKEAMGRLNAAGAITARDASSDISPAARDFWLYKPWVFAVLVLVMLVASVSWFFRGSSWAGTNEPKPGIPASSREEVRRRLLAINEMDVPYKITEENGRIVVSYRFGDARWVDLARAHGLSRTHRMVLDLDESSNTVRTVDQQSTLDWSAGANGGSVKWTNNIGIIFFQKEYTQVYGLQISKDGRIIPQLSYTYEFDVQEMKAPFIQAVNGAGWRWRPVLLHAPKSLLWLIG